LRVAAVDGKRQVFFVQPTAVGAPETVTLSIVVPLYRSADTLARLLDALGALEVDGGHEIVLVHDGSPDDTLSRCRALIPLVRVPVTLVDLSRNFGEHNAVLAGLRVARGRAVVTMDDDLQNPPSEVMALVRRLFADDLDCVYGVYREKRHSLFRNLGSRMTNWMSRFVLEKPRDLYLSSFRCMSAFLAAEVARYEGPFPYIDGLILQATRRIGSVEVEHAARTSGESGYTLRKLVRLWTSMFVNFSVMPLRAATALGFVLGSVGAGLFAVVLHEYFTTGASVRGWGSLMAAIAVFSGAQLVMLGLIGEYVGRLFLTTNRKPQSVVRGIERCGGSSPGAGEETVRVRRDRLSVGAGRRG
jgi:undecaprenyl-phosphate 4-deoxy-4-formamido-L-arabinose transferase